MKLVSDGFLKSMSLEAKKQGFDVTFTANDVGAESSDGKIKIIMQEPEKGLFLELEELVEKYEMIQIDLLPNDDGNNAAKDYDLALEALGITLSMIEMLRFDDIDRSGNKHFREHILGEFKTAVNKITLGE